ncbi:hypothetical protein CFC21_080134, partial [Triticum aestivum]
LRAPPPAPRPPPRLLRRPARAAPRLRLRPQRHPLAPPPPPGPRHRRHAAPAAAPLADPARHGGPDRVGAGVPPLRGEAARGPPRRHLLQHLRGGGHARPARRLRAVAAPGDARRLLHGDRAGGGVLHGAAGHAGVPGPGLPPVVPADGEERRVQLRRGGAGA